MDAALTETDFLAQRRESHASRLGVSTYAHSALCVCGRADTFCARCGRDDFGRPSEALSFTGAGWVCSDCLDLELEG